MNQDKPTQEQPTDTQPVDDKRNEAQAATPPQDPRRRLRELLAIPDRERSDAVWDEIISLEIQLAPGNRAPSPQTDGGRRQDSGRRQEQPGRRPEHVRRQEPPSGLRPAKRFIKKPRRGPGSSNK